MTRDPTDVRQQWVDRSRAYSPEYYAYYGPDERSDHLLTVLEDRLDREATVLELGCGSGRHLSHLAANGYEDLVGVDVNGAAFDVLERTYPDLAAAGTFHHGALESVVPSFETDRFDLAYSVETLQHLHPSCDWLLDELHRVTADLLVTAEIESERGDDRGGDRAQVGVDRDDIDRESDGDGVRETDVDGVTLYKRRWDRVLDDAGFDELTAIDCDRVTFRLFRST